MHCTCLEVERRHLPRTPKAAHMGEPCHLHLSMRCRKNGYVWRQIWLDNVQFIHDYKSIIYYYQALLAVMHAHILPRSSLDHAIMKPLQWTKVNSPMLMHACSKNDLKHSNDTVLYFVYPLPSQCPPQVHIRVILVDTLYHVLLATYACQDQK